MGEQKRKHVQGTITKAILCGATFEERSSMVARPQKSVFGAKIRRGYVWHAYEDEVLVCTGATEYQCAVAYLQTKGIPYEALVYSNERVDRSKSARLRRWERERGCDTSKP